LFFVGIRRFLGRIFCFVYASFLRLGGKTIFYFGFLFERAVCISKKIVDF